MTNQQINAVSTKTLVDLSQARRGALRALLLLSVAGCAIAAALPAYAGDVSGTPDGINQTTNGVPIVIDGNGSITGLAGDGIEVQATDASITITNNGAITGVDGYGILAETLGSVEGDITITGNGDVTGSAGGIDVRAATGSILVDTTGASVTGSGGTGIGAILGSSTATATIKTGDVSGTNGVGVWSLGADFAIDTSGGKVTASNGAGIAVQQSGAGATDIKTGDIKAVLQGIWVWNPESSAKAVTIDSSAGSIEAGIGIEVDHEGTGLVSITTGDITAVIEAIKAKTSSVDGMVIDSTAGTLTSVSGAAVLAQSLAGGLSIKTGDVAGTFGANGIVADSYGDLVIDTTAGSVSGLEAVRAVVHHGAALVSTADVTGNGSAVVVVGDVNAGDILLDTTKGSIVSTGDAGVGAVSGGAGDIVIRTADVASYNAAVVAQVFGPKGSITIDTSAGDVSSEAYYGIQARSTANDLIDIATANVEGKLAGIVAQAVGDSSAGVKIKSNGAVSGEFGIYAVSTGAGTIDVDMTGSVTGKTGLQVANAGGAITIANHGTLSGSDWAFKAEGNEAGSVSFANSGTIEGKMQFGVKGDTLTNSGSFKSSGTTDFGAGADMFTNGGTLLAVGNTSFIGLEQFSNSGTIDLGGAAGGTTMAFSGNYVGDSAVLQMAVDFLGASDQLKIDGAATGSTRIDIADLTSAPVQFGSVVLVDAGAGTSADAFTLGTVINSSGFSEYTFSFNAAAADFLLSLLPTDASLEATSIMRGAQSLWYRSSDAWADHRAGDAAAARGPLWMSVYAEKAKRDDRQISPDGSTIELDNSQRFTGIQGGFDIGARAGEDGIGGGVTAGYLKSNLDFDSRSPEARFKATNLGASLSFKSGGFFADALAKIDWIKGKLTDEQASGYNGTMKGKAYGLRAQAGYRFGDDRFHVQPRVALEYVRNKLDSLALDGAQFVFEDTDGLRGTAGVLVGGSHRGGDGSRVGYFLQGSAVHDFADDATARLVIGPTDYAFAVPADGTYGRLEGGLSYDTPRGLGAFLKAKVDRGNGYSSYGASAGFRLNF